jgi:hypothetical protein
MSGTHQAFLLQPTDPISTADNLLAAFLRKDIELLHICHNASRIERDAQSFDANLTVEV